MIEKTIEEIGIEFMKRPAIQKITRKKGLDIIGFSAEIYCLIDNCIAIGKEDKKIKCPHCLFEMSEDMFEIHLKNVIKREIEKDLIAKIEKEVLHEKEGFPLSVPYLVVKKEDWEEFKASLKQKEKIA